MNFIKQLIAACLFMTSVVLQACFDSIDVLESGPGHLLLGCWIFLHAIIAMY